MHVFWLHCWEPRLSKLVVSLLCAGVAAAAPLGGKPKKRSIISATLQGELEVTTLAGTGKGKAAAASKDVVERVPFMLMGLELPPTPLFKDALEKNIIPQVGSASLAAAAAAAVQVWLLCGGARSAQDLQQLYCCHWLF